LGVGDRTDRDSFVQVILDKEKSQRVKKKSGVRLGDMKSPMGERKIVSNEDVIIKSTNYTILMYESKFYIWGNVLNQIYAEPLKINELSSIQVKDISISDSFVLVLSSLNNLGNIRYLSFVPPVVGSGTFEGLVRYMFDENCTDKFKEILLFTYPEISSHSEFLKTLSKLLEGFLKNPNLSSDMSNAKK
jgi:hypothetical protein